MTSNIACLVPMFEVPNTMPDATDPPIYVALMRLKPEGLAPGRWATDAGLARNYFNGLRSHGNPSGKALESLLDVIGKSYTDLEAEFPRVATEVVPTGPTSARELRREFYGDKPLPTIPMYGTAHGGEYGDLADDVELTELIESVVIDHLKRPASLAHDEWAYAVTIVGNSMAPRYRSSERAIVSPKAAIGIGDDIVVQLRGPDGDGERIKMVLIKELVKRTGSYIELKQHNPEMTFRVPTAQVAAMHRVQGRYF